ncbi:acyltransferase [Algoriphagus formosus]|uniref:acyltransferase n=1 Tax=Algoriphagus formosus TaxID=2007308 RepID=UPI003F72B4B5
MKNINIYQKYKSFIKHLRGLFYNIFLYSGKSKNLRVASNVEMWGDITLGNNIYVGSNSKIYTKVILSDGVYIGDNVELRSNGGNKISIGINCTVNRGSLIIGEVKIGSNCLIAPLCVVVGSNHNFSNVDELINKQGISSKGIKIGDNVWLGAHVTVLDGVHIGANSVIGAGSVVTKDVPANSVAVGNPCKVVKERKGELKA